MRGPPLVVLAACAVGCFFQPMEASQTDGTSGPDPTVTTTTAPPPTAEPPICPPNTPFPCACDGELGEMLCTPDGQGFGPCDCPVDPTTTTSPISTTGTTDDSTTTGTTDASTTTGTTAPLDTTTTTGSTTTGSTTDTSTTDASTTGAPMCADDFEPDNDTYQGAVEHPEQNCGGTHSFMSTLAGQDDIDWHSFAGSPGAACDSPPRLQVNQESAAEVRLCVYLVCVLGSPPDLECNTGMYTDAMIAEGCCGTGDIDITYDCPGANEDVFAFVSLDAAMIDVCVDYKIDYSYFGD